jgi:hypothetical protein
MPNSAHEAKRLQAELPKFERQVKIACMDSKADDYPLYRQLKDHYDIQLLTTMRRGKDKTPERQQMRRELNTERHRRIYAQRSHMVEPMQSLVKNIFELDQCWMRGNANNRWLFAAMGLAVQIAQFQAYQYNLSTWCVKDAVLFRLTKVTLQCADDNMETFALQPRTNGRTSFERWALAQGRSVVSG